MSLFRRTPRTETPVREYESWEPAEVDPDAAPGLDAPVKSGRSRTGTEHLTAARDALDAADKRDS